jgi:threonine synthase
MTPVRPFLSAASGEAIDPASGLWRCSVTGSHLNLAPGPGLRRSDIEQKTRSLWRYRTAMSGAPSDPLTRGEGLTPLVTTGWYGQDVHWKLDFMNPSGSFKDRGFALLINYLVDLGVTSVSEDSSGNGGASLATYAAAAQLTCRIYVPASTSASKIAQIAAAGSEVIRVPGTRQAVADAAIADDTGAYYASHNWHPMFIEGVKTVGYEIWEQLGFRAPDVIVAPAGSGSNILGCHTAFSELRRAGEVERLPRLVAIQSEACNPLAGAFADGLDHYKSVQPTKSIAEGIAVSQPIRAKEVLMVARDTNGGVFSVSEGEIYDAYAGLARIGLYVEPTSATAAAGVVSLHRTGRIAPGETTVVILTGSGLKSGVVVQPA